MDIVLNRKYQEALDRNVSTTYDVNDLSKLNQNQLLDIYDFQMSIITYEFKQESQEKLRKEISFLREIKDFLRKLRVHND